ncbi:putative SecY/SEC61-alpha family protein [Helianthus anomalus]
MGGGFRVLHLVRSFLAFLPEVQSADRKVLFRWCRGFGGAGPGCPGGAGGLLFHPDGVGGLLFHLGITPIVTSGLVIPFVFVH